MEKQRTEDSARLAEAVRSACVQAALDAYEDAGVRGICAEGRWEVALDAVRSLDLDALIRERGEPPATPDRETVRAD